MTSKAVARDASVASVDCCIGRFTEGRCTEGRSTRGPAWLVYRQSGASDVANRGLLSEPSFSLPTPPGESQLEHFSHPQPSISALWGFFDDRGLPVQCSFCPPVQFRGLPAQCSFSAVPDRGLPVQCSFCPVQFQNCLPRSLNCAARCRESNAWPTRRRRQSGANQSRSQSSTRHHRVPQLPLRARRRLRT